MGLATSSFYAMPGTRDTVQVAMKIGGVFPRLIVMPPLPPTFRTSRTI